MTVVAFLVAAALLGHSRASIVELSCSDNATCIENLAKEFVRSVRQQKTVRLFDTITVEPLGTRQARSNEGLLPRILNNNAFSFDWNDYTFRIWKARDRSDALDLEVFESRTAKDVSEDLPKKSKSKVEEETEEVVDKKNNKKSPKGGIIRRRAKKKIMQAVIPMLFGMKSAAAVLFAMGVVTVLTMKAFLASKLALFVTVGMAVKRLYESWGMGLFLDPTMTAMGTSPFGFAQAPSLFGSVGLQNHPYLYSQYPIDFPSASSHAYSVSGMSPQFPEMYNPTAMGTQQQSELLQNDASAQQSQQAPTVQLLNSTRASERWDGKSKLEKLIEPIVEGIRKFIDPITSIFYSMPATFRGLNSDVSTAKTVETEEGKKPREILVPQPRYIAQRKMNYRKAQAQFRSRPKKYTELKVDLDKLKRNKDLHDYIKTKKYKYNYQHTYYYPRVKYFVNPNTFIVKPKNTRLVPYRKEIYNASIVPSIVNSTVPVGLWKPVVLVPVLLSNSSNIMNKTENFPKQSMNLDPPKTRVKRSLVSFFNNVGSEVDNLKKDTNFEIDISGRGLAYFINKLFDSDPVTGMVKYATKYANHAIKHSLNSHTPPYYYSMTYELLMMTLDVIDGLVQVHEALSDYFLVDLVPKKKAHVHGQHGQKQKQKKKKKKKPLKKKPLKKPHGGHQNLSQNQYGQSSNENVDGEDDEKEEEGTLEGTPKTKHFF